MKKNVRRIRIKNADKLDELSRALNKPKIFVISKAVDNMWKKTMKEKK